MSKSNQTFDPRSETVVLEYQGKDADDDAGEPGWQPHLGGIPSRDLTEADICRLVYTRALNEYDGTPDSPPMPDPAKPSQAKARALVELLLSRQVDGKAVFKLAKPTKAPKATAADKVADPAADTDADASARNDDDTPAETPAQPEV